LPTAYADSRSEAEARAAYKIADRHYRAGRYRAAIVEFRRAYKLSDRKEMLYNIANCLERLGEYGKAAKNLEQYLEAGGADESGVLAERVASLKLRTPDTVSSIRLSSPSSPSSTTLIPTSSPENVERPSRSTGHYYWLAGGVVGLGAGVGLALAARHAHSEAATRCTSNSVCGDGASKYLDRERTFAVAADASFVLGAVATTVGIALWLRASGTDRKDTRSSHTVSVWATPELVGVGFGGQL